MEEKFIKFDDTKLKTFIQWFLKARSTDKVRESLNKIYCNHGLLVACDGYRIIRWDIRGLNYDSGAIHELQQLEGLFSFEIHGKYLLAVKSELGFDRYPNFELIMKYGRLLAKSRDWKYLNLDVANVCIDTRYLNHIARIPFPSTSILIQIDHMFRLRAESFEIGKIHVVIMPKLFIERFQTFLSPGIDGDMNDIGKYFEFCKGITSHQYLEKTSEVKHEEVLSV